MNLFIYHEIAAPVNQLQWFVTIYGERNGEPAAYYSAFDARGSFRRLFSYALMLARTTNHYVLIESIPPYTWKG